MATRTKAHLRGHPLHPMLVPIPIGLFAWALVSIVVFALSDANMFWYDMAFWTAIAGIIAAAVAALPGLADGLGVAFRTEARNTAMAHMLLNTVVIVLFGASVLMMWGQAAVSGSALTAVIALKSVAVGILLISGWLGGELVFKHRIGIEPDSHEAPRTTVRQPR